MQRIYGAVDSMHDLIRDLLVYTQVGTEHVRQLHRVVLEEVVQSAIARVREASIRRVQLWNRRCSPRSRQMRIRSC